MNISSLNCPRCNRKMEPMVNGGSLWLRCTNESPRCGVVWPAETARCAEVEKRGETKDYIAGADGPVEVSTPWHDNLAGTPFADRGATSSP